MRLKEAWLHCSRSSESLFVITGNRYMFNKVHSLTACSVLFPPYCLRARPLSSPPTLQARSLHLATVVIMQLDTFTQKAYFSGL